MKHIICIGECTLDIVFENSQPIGSMPGGRIINAAAAAARTGLPVLMASEVSDDPVGAMIIDFLKNAGVDLNTPAPIEFALKEFDNTLTELEKLLAK